MDIKVQKHAEFYFYYLKNKSRNCTSNILKTQRKYLKKYKKKEHSEKKIH